jgi:hypothetical protein
LSVRQPPGTVSRQYGTPALLTRLYTMVSGHSSGTKSSSIQTKVSVFLCERRYNHFLGYPYNTSIQSPADSLLGAALQTRAYPSILSPSTVSHSWDGTTESNSTVSFCITTAQQTRNKNDHSCMSWWWYWYRYGTFCALLDGYFLQSW